MTPNESIQKEKQSLRKWAKSQLRDAPDLEERGEAIQKRLLLLPELCAARRVMSYVSFGTEVPTQQLLAALLKQEKTVVVPYCRGEELELFHLQEFSELSPGVHGILEPRRNLQNAKKKINPSDLDVILVPGLAFDRQCFRLGRGAGYYDKFLAQFSALQKPPTTIGLSYQCQMVEHVPREAHDQKLQFVITENQIFRANS